MRSTYRDHTVLYPGVTHPEAAKVLTVSAADDVTGVRVTIDDAQAASISGIVRRPDGAPVAGSYVKLERPSFSYGSPRHRYARPAGRLVLVRAPLSRRIHRPSGLAIW